MRVTKEYGYTVYESDGYDGEVEVLKTIYIATALGALLEDPRRYMKLHMLDTDITVEGVYE